MSDMNDSAPYAIKNALMSAGFTLGEILDLANQKRLLEGLKRRYDARQGQTNSELASQSHKPLPPRSGGAIETTGS